MPNKPHLMLTRAGEQIPNDIGMAGDGLRVYGNPEHIQYALEQWTEDLEAGHPQRMRYTRIRKLIIERFHCERRTAEAALKGARGYNADMFAAQRKLMVPEIVEQLQRIADNNEDKDPTAAIAALREINHMIGAHEPNKLQVEHGITPEQLAMIEALKLAPHERRARIAELRREAMALPAGPPALPGPGDDVH